MIKVVFVCTGNICRSPMADAIFQQMVEDVDLVDEVMVDSAGTIQYHVGEPAHRGTLKILEREGILYHGRARQFTVKDLELFDYVLGMDKTHLSSIQSMPLSPNAKAEVNLFLHYAYAANRVSVLEVPDPYYNNQFDVVYDLVSKGSKALLEHIRAKHKL